MSEGFLRHCPDLRSLRFGLSAQCILLEEVVRFPWPSEVVSLLALQSRHFVKKAPRPPCSPHLLTAACGDALNDKTPGRPH